MSIWKDKNVLVTGCNGLMGGPLCKALLASGARVTGYDTSIYGSLQDYGIQRDVDVIKDTILSGTRLRGALVNQEVVFHLAALAGVEQSRQSKSNAFEVNVRGTWIVLQEALDQGKMEAVMVASSNHIYGDHHGQSTPEIAQLRQLDTYSATKIMVDYVARAYAHNYGLPTGIIRNTNCYGPYDPHHDHIIPGTILSVLRGEQPIIRSRGITKKSYLFVDDVISAYLVAAEYIMSDKVKGVCFNVADTPVSVRDLVTTIMRVAGVEKEPIVLGQANDQSDENLDAGFIRNLGWKPRYSLEQGIGITLEAFKKRIGHESGTGRYPR